MKSHNFQEHSSCRFLSLEWKWIVDKTHLNLLNAPCFDDIFILNSYQRIWVSKKPWDRIPVWSKLGLNTDGFNDILIFFWIIRYIFVIIYTVWNQTLWSYTHHMSNILVLVTRQEFITVMFHNYSKTCFKGHPISQRKCPFITGSLTSQRKFP